VISPDKRAWVRAAACRDTDPEDWFPLQGERNVPRWLRDLCGGCPVRRDCLEEALDHHDTGIWGGLNPQQRNRLRRGRTRYGYCIHCGALYQQPKKTRATCSEECRRARHAELKRARREQARQQDEDL